MTGRARKVTVAERHDRTQRDGEDGLQIIPLGLLRGTLSGALESLLPVERR